MKANIEEIETATEGERLVHRFLEEAARPRGDYDFWYEPQLGHSGLSPDFILYGKSLGLVVLEVKDWVAGQIVSYDPHRFQGCDLRKCGKKDQSAQAGQGLYACPHGRVERARGVSVPSP